ncbi:glycosyltransferase family 2 protein [Longivirga aurantiaca]|uniref:Glycosyltransferase family 2 protein n=1 Tax=Longivirga aurantiaca TaxID=1837743 RepID=A0ABW1SWN0_9ACTN
MSGTWVVVPAFDEAENLEVLVPRILDHLDLIPGGGHVLVVDDGSRDSTPDVMAKLCADNDRVHVDRSVRNRGKAAAMQRGFALAIDEGATAIVMMDADGQDDPAELPRLVARLDDGFDLVTGARVERNDRFVKRHTSRLYNWATGRLSGAPGRDFNSGFKAMRPDVARDVSPMLYGELHRYVTVIAHWLGYRITEEPVQHHERMFGKSKYGIARFFRGFMDLMTVRFLMSYEHRPSHLFGGIGIVSFLLGGAVLAYLTVLRFLGQTIGDRPLLIAGVLLVVVGVQLLLFGLLAELVVYNRQRDGRTKP